MAQNFTKKSKKSGYIMDEGKLKAIIDSEI